MRTLTGIASMALVLVLAGFLASAQAVDESVTANLVPNLDPPVALPHEVATEEEMPAGERVVHAILIGQTDHPRGGKAAQQDIDRVQQMLKEEISLERRRILVLTGSSCNAREIMQTVRDLRRSARCGDTIFCYYSGRYTHDDRHANCDPSGGQFLQLDGGDLLRQTLFANLRAQPGRLRVLITSDTSNRLGYVGYPTVLVKQFRHNGTTALERLLLHHQGCVDLSATPRRQRNWSNDEMGTLFTFSLLRTVAVPEGFQAPDSTPDGLCSEWQTFVNNLSCNANQLFRDVRKRIIDDPDKFPEALVWKAQEQQEMRPKVFCMSVARDPQIPGGHERTIQKTLYSLVFAPK